MIELVGGLAGVLLMIFSMASHVCKDHDQQMAVLRRWLRDRELARAMRGDVDPSTHWWGGCTRCTHVTVREHHMPEMVCGAEVGAGGACEGKIVRLLDQDASFAAFRFGGWDAVAALAEVELRNQRLASALAGDAPQHRWWTRWSRQ